nr:venom polypeptide precursor [Doratifera vulnerans]
MRTLKFIILVCSLYTANCSEDTVKPVFESHDLILGKAMSGDTLLLTSTEKKIGFPLIKRTSEIVFPEPGKENFAHITAIVIKDKYTDGNGGLATILAGGLGKKFVKIKLATKRGHGFHFTVKIYGRN